jgi:hypothetical protein
MPNKALRKVEGAVAAVAVTTKTPVLLCPLLAGQMATQD